MHYAPWIAGGHVIHEFGTRLVTVNFNPGIKLEIAESNKLLNIILYLPQAMKGMHRYGSG